MQDDPWLPHTDTMSHVRAAWSCMSSGHRCTVLVYEDGGTWVQWEVDTRRDAIEGKVSLGPGDDEEVEVEAAKTAAIAVARAMGHRPHFPVAR